MKLVSTDIYFKISPTMTSHVYPELYVFIPANRIIGTEYLDDA